MKNIIIVLPLVILLSSWAVVRPGKAGIKQGLGKFSDEITIQGAVLFNPFNTKVVKASVQTSNLELFLNLPSKEGLNKDSEINNNHII